MLRMDPSKRIERGSDIGEDGGKGRCHEFVGRDKTPGVFYSVGMQLLDC